MPRAARQNVPPWWPSSRCRPWDHWELGRKDDFAGVFSVCLLDGQLFGWLKLDSLVVNEVALHCFCNDFGVGQFLIEFHFQSSICTINIRVYD